MTGRSAYVIIISTIFWTTLVSCSEPDISYTTNCASFVPESTPGNPEPTTVPFPPNQEGFYLGGDGLFPKHPNSSRYYYSINGRKVLLFVTHHIFSTALDDVFKVQASLVFQPTRIHHQVEDLVFTSYSYSPRTFSGSSESGPLKFELEGFWSKSMGKLCMVGSSTSKSTTEGETRLLLAVLKLTDVWSSNTITSLAKGTLNSLISSGDDFRHFQPLSLLMFSKMNYEYTKGSKDSVDRCNGGIDVPKSESLSLPFSKSIYSIFSRSYSFQLEYTKNCTSSSKNCSPFGDSAGALPQTMSFNLIQCSDDIKSLRFLVEFSNNTGYVSYYGPFDPETTLVAEGSWDVNKNQLCLVACRISNATTSFNNSHVEDCSTKLSLRFPSVWSIKESNGIVGRIWSTKNVVDPGHFNHITFQNLGNEVHGIPELKYNYSMIVKANNSCKLKKPTRSQYPGENSFDMQFSMSVKNSSRNKLRWGSFEPIFVSDQPWNVFPKYSQSRHGQVKEKTDINKLLNVSYKITLPPFDSSGDDQLASSYSDATVKISAEGIYDVNTGQLCMVGCRHLDPKNLTSVPVSMDCEILVEVEFPPSDSRNRIKGEIKSTRQESDSLYFKPLTFSASSHYSYRARESIWRMDFEIVMALVSNTSLFIFVAFQIFYLRKHPNAFPTISLAMLLVLAAGHLIPLVLNFEALFSSKQNQRTYYPWRSGGWLEVHEVVIRVLTMAAFLLQVRLLQLVWSARSAKEVEKTSWNAEKKTVYTTLPLYIAGGLIVLLVNWKKYQFSDNETDYYQTRGQQRSMLTDLRSYAGLILDGFLIPQILFNIFLNSKEIALSRLFFWGTTLVRLLPHAYDLYRARYYDDDDDGLVWSYSYANPSADYYSTAWDVLIPLVGLFFAAILHLQQRFGGRFFLPRRFKEYVKVPTMSEA